MSSAPSSLDVNVNYDALCKSEVPKSDKFTFVWEIPDFSLRPEKKGEIMRSDGFCIMGPGSKVTKWCVALLPKGTKDYDVISAFLYNASDEDVLIKCSLTIVTGHNKKLEHNVLVQDANGMIEANGGKCLFFSMMNDFYPLHLDVLKLLVEITVFGESKKTMKVVDRSIKTELLSKNLHQDQLSNDLGLFFSLSLSNILDRLCEQWCITLWPEAKEFADVTISCHDKVFDCHKIILASRSAVFRSMFSSNMKEEIAGNVKIENMAPEVLENMLLYIYTGTAPCIDRLAKELLAASEQYQIEKLKALCEIKLCSEIEIGNCIDLLILGDFYQAPTLKTEALRFLSQNVQKIDISEYKKALIANPDLLYEVMENLLPRRDDSEPISKKRRA